MLPLCSASLNEFPSQISCCLTYFFLTVPRVFCKILFYLFLDRGKGREKERERNFKVWLPLIHLQLGICSATQACALTGNQTRDPLVRRPALSPRSHTSQGSGPECLHSIHCPICPEHFSPPGFPLVSRPPCNQVSVQTPSPHSHFP